MGRIDKSIKNIMFGYIGTLTSTVMGFVLRTIFVIYLDKTLLGVNGLYTGILTVLSLAELGIGTAFNYSLYEPVANNRIEKIKSYMLVYKRAYNLVILVVTILGLCIIPFLKYIINKPGNYSINELTIYYLIFLFNTVTTYFMAYKYSLANAQQKNYIQVNFLTITKLIVVLIQIVVIIVTKSFLLYLIVAAIVEFIQKLVANSYLNRQYPYLLDKNVEPLPEQEKKDIISNVRALMLHRIGDMARLQTDNIIVSSFINVGMVGMIDNYTLVINSVASFVNIVFNSVISSFGNMIATEGVDKQYKTFRIYRFVANWVYGLFAVGFYLMLSEVVRLWLGPDWILSQGVVGAIMIDFYFKGDRIVLANYKTAAGVFEQDKYLAMIQGIVNLILSIILVIRIGLIGIYIGTIVSGLIANIVRPIIVYRICFNKSSREYFIKMGQYVVLIMIALLISIICDRYIMESIVGQWRLVMIPIIAIIYNMIFIIAYRKSEEYRYIVVLLKERLQSLMIRIHN